jgi:hypothetical protein
MLVWMILNILWDFFNSSLLFSPTQDVKGIWIAAILEEEGLPRHRVRVIFKNIKFFFIHKIVKRNLLILPPGHHVNKETGNILYNPPPTPFLLLS